MRVTFDLRMARYHMWAQTSSCVYIAVYVPTGYQDQEVFFECTAHEVRLQPENSPPVVHRMLDGAISSSSRSSQAERR